VAPSVVAPDSLTNNDVGWKTTWFNRRSQWNGTVHQEDWSHAQIGALDSGLLGGAIINGGNYRVRGFETSGSSRIMSGVTIEAGAAWNHSVLFGTYVAEQSLDHVQP
jgi:iron complex outermembrane recepter protein